MIGKYQVSLMLQDLAQAIDKDLIPSGGERLLRLESYDPEFRLGVATLYREER